MKYVYHGSHSQGLKVIRPNKSTHGTYVYGTPEKVLALHFSKMCGDDLTYDIGHFSKKDGPWELVENIPKAFDKMYSNPASVYTLAADSFKDIHTGFNEVVSDVEVDVISEENYKNTWEGLLQAEQDGLLKIYRYPNKPNGFKKDGRQILDKWRFYKTKLNKNFKKYEFDRLLFLHPKLLNEINGLSKEFNYSYQYTKNDLIDIFKDRVERQLEFPNYEEFIDSAFISICDTYPELKTQIEKIYNEYKSK